jgi:hypothetical protein
MHNTTQEQAIYPSQPSVDSDVHLGKDFECEGEKRFSPAYTHGYILFIVVSDWNIATILFIFTIKLMNNTFSIHAISFILYRINKCTDTS